MPKPKAPSVADVAANAAAAAAAAATSAAAIDPSKALTVSAVGPSPNLDILAVQMSHPTQKLLFDCQTEGICLTVTASLKVQNKGTEPLLYRCWTSWPVRYCIVPSRGVIRSDQDVEISFRLSDNCVDSLALMLEDRIMIALAPCSNPVDLAIEGALSTQPLESSAQLFDSPTAYDKCCSPDSTFKKSVIRTLLSIQVDFTPAAQRRILAILCELQRQCSQCSCCCNY